jgi:hypothetical protein
MQRAAFRKSSSFSGMANQFLLMAMAGRFRSGLKMKMTNTVFIVSKEASPGKKRSF